MIQCHAQARASIRSGIFLLALMTAGCGGAGVTPTATPIAKLTQPPGNPLVPSVLTIGSNPAGMTVLLNGRQIGTTPMSYTPGYNNPVGQYRIVSGITADYLFSTDQIANGPHTIYYNAQADTTGSIGTISVSAVARSADGRSRSMFDDSTVRRMPERAGGRPFFSASRLAVRYRVSALHSGSRTASDVERFEGIASGTDIGFQHDDTAMRVVDLGAGQTIDGVSAALRSHPEVVWVDRVHLRYLAAVNPTVPNDTHYASDQWGLVQIGAPFAWTYSQGDPRVTIAMLDTGADFTHADLVSKIVIAKKIVSSNLSISNAAIVDLNGHGTNVAGIAAAATNNGFGYAGAGYNVSLGIYKIFGDDGSTSTVDEALAMYAAVADGARVINLSFGGCQLAGPDPIEHDAIAYALAHNVVVVAAAGNERASSADPNCVGAGSTVDFPAAYDGVISVGASALDDSANPGSIVGAVEKVARYSNSGPQLSVVAPGGNPTGSGDPDILHWIANIYSTSATQLACSNKSDCRVRFAGTSQAAPHVSGAAALLLSVKPNLTPPQIAQILTSTADDIGDPNQGHGRLNMYRAMAAAVGDVAPVPPTNLNFVAFAYTNGGTGSNRPAITNVTYPRGVPVASNGTFRIADLPPPIAPYRIAVWYDANGNGIIDAGDWFGVSAPCPASGACNASNITAAKVTPGFALP